MVRVPRGESAAPPGTGILVPAALLAGVVAFGLARLTLLPGLGFWDTGELQVVGPVLGTAHPTGFPAYVLLGWLASIAFAPFGDPAFRMNLLSAVLVGGATTLTVVLAHRLTGHVWIAFATGLVMAAVPIVWTIGTRADAHALHVFLVALLLVLLVGWERRVRTAGGGSGSQSTAGRRRLARPGDRWLLAAALVFGVSLANHTLTLLLAPGIGLYVLAAQPGILRRPRFIMALAVALLATTALLFLELPLRAGVFRAPLVYGHPERLGGFLYVVFAQQFLGALDQPFANLGGKIVTLGQFSFDQLGELSLVIPIAFVVAVKRQPRYALLTGVSVLITAWFASSYVNADISRYYLGPAVMVLSWLALLAAEVVELLARVMRAEVLDAPRGVMMSPRRVARFGTTSPVAFVLEVTLAVAFLVPTVQALPDRARAADLTSDHVASEWAHRAMLIMEPDAVVVSWWSYSTTLWYAQIVEGLRPDVWIVDDRTRLDDNLGEVTDVIDAQLGHRPVYVVRLAGDDDLAAVEARFDVQVFTMPTEQPIMKILGRRAP